MLSRFLTFFTKASGNFVQRSFHVDKGCYSIASDEEKIQRQHDFGKLTAGERIFHLVDDNSFIDFVTDSSSIPLLSDDGVICGQGQIEGRDVFIFSQDFTFEGGTISMTNSKRICDLIEDAIEANVPIIGIYDSGGAKIQDASDALEAVGNLFKANLKASGVVPQISLICGSCAGGSVFSPALTDIVVMNKVNSHMFLTGPNVVKSMSGEEVSFDDLGGSDLHSEISGVCTLETEDEMEMFDLTRRLCSYLPTKASLNYAHPSAVPVEELGEEIFEIIPSLRSDEKDIMMEEIGYDILDVLEVIFDESSVLELYPRYGSNVVTALAQAAGLPVLVIANQPASTQQGSLDCDSMKKMKKVLDMSSHFGLPVLSLLDIPGFRAGAHEEGKGIIWEGSELLKSISQCKSPKMTVVTRRVFGGAYLMMGCHEADVLYAWPGSKIGVMDSNQALELIGGKFPGNSLDEKEDYYLDLMDSQVAHSKGYIDDIISPQDTRKKIIEFLHSFQSK